MGRGDALVAGPATAGHRRDGGTREGTRHTGANRAPGNGSVSKTQPEIALHQLQARRLRRESWT